MLKKQILKLLFLCAAALGLASGAAYGQVVSSAMTGTVIDNTGAPVAGATVIAVHTPTNTKYTATTGANGRFAFSGMQVGGPYSINATASGFEVEPLNDVQTSLGEAIDVALVAKPEVIKLEKFVTTASRADLDSNATGASSVLSNQRITIQPTTSRSFADLAKTNPFVSIRAFPQIQALGINSRFNSIMLDGAKINDSFGLNSSGLFSLQNPFSLDAVEQFSVQLNPVDVRQSGFAGAAINVVSKSGTNEFHGSVYDIFTDTNWQGTDVFGSTKGTRAALKERTYGFTLGGPIWKDHLFFFVNWEKFIQDKAPTTASITPSASFLTDVQTRIAALPGAPNLGAFGGLPTNRLADTKRLAKIDWKITDDHRLSVRYSDTIGTQPSTGSLNATSFSQPVSNTQIPSSGFTNGTTALSSNFYNLNVKEHVWAAQLFDTWTPDLKTQFSYTNTKQDQVRATPVIYPEIRILGFPATTNSGSTVTTLDAFRFGTETSSMGNEIHIKDQTMSGSADYTWNSITFTAGGDHETIDFYNLFRQGSYGIFSYASLSDFQNDRPAGFERAVVQSGFPVADISKFEQTGVFAQAKWEPTSRFNATLGLRIDYLSSPIAPSENAAFKNAFGMTNAGTIDGTNVPAPRFGFNYALDSKRLTQIRGGFGVYLGRNPWVWISNSYGNTGVGRFNVVSTSNVPTLTQYLSGTYSNPDPAYKFDPTNPIGSTNTTGTASSINLIKPGLKLPTIERGNLAVDRKLPFLDATATVEYEYTEQLDALFVDNMNLQAAGAAADGRTVFQRLTKTPSGTWVNVPMGSTVASNGQVTDPLGHVIAPSGSAITSNTVNTGFANVIRTRDVHAGKSNYISIMLDRPFKNGWAYTVAYTRGHATEAQTLNSSTANSQWTFNSVFSQGTTEVARSDYEIKDRLQVMVGKQLKLWHGLLTTASLYYEGRSGQPYSWVYGSDLNYDSITGDDLVAVPTDNTDKRFDFSGMNATQQTAYFAFLKSSGLSKFAGGYAPRNAFLGPWQNRLDLHLSQEVPIYKPFKTEFFMDFINFGSWISRGLFNYVDEINTSTSNGGQTRTLGTASLTAAGLIKPGVTLDANNNVSLASSSLVVPNNGDSRWKVQAGIRLKF